MGIVRFFYHVANKTWDYRYNGWVVPQVREPVFTRKLGQKVLSQPRLRELVVNMVARAPKVAGEKNTLLVDGGKARRKEKSAQRDATPPPRSLPTGNTQFTGSPPQGPSIKLHAFFESHTAARTLFHAPIRNEWSISLFKQFKAESVQPSP